MIAGDDVQRRLLELGEGAQLVAEDHVVSRQDAVDDDEVSVHLLEQRANGGDADAAADQQPPSRVAARRR